MSGQGICVGIVSGKGGTGKTSLTAGIGAALAKLGKRTLCMDCGNLRNLDLAMGLTEQSLMDFTDVAAGRVALKNAVAEHPLQPGLFLLNAPASGGVASLTRPEMDALADEIKSGFDFCLMDAPSGMGGAFPLILSASDRVLVVCGLDPLSARDAQRVVMELDAFPSDAARLIVNRFDASPFRRREITVDDVMDEAGLPLMGLVPQDGAVSRALGRGAPVTLSEPNSAASRACERIARRLNGESVKIPRPYLML